MLDGLFNGAVGGVVGGAAEEYADRKKFGITQMWFFFSGLGFLLVFSIFLFNSIFDGTWLTGAWDELLILFVAIPLGSGAVIGTFCTTVIVIGRFINNLKGVKPGQATVPSQDSPE
jgi:hypothetical protein